MLDAKKWRQLDVIVHKNVERMWSKKLHNLSEKMISFESSLPPIPIESILNGFHQDNKFDIVVLLLEE